MLVSSKVPGTTSSSTLVMVAEALLSTPMMPASESNRAGHIREISFSLIDHDGEGTDILLRQSWRWKGREYVTEGLSPGRVGLSMGPQIRLLVFV